MPRFYIGQSVTFSTRNGSPDGLTGQGKITKIITDNLTRYIVAYSYTVEAGPYKGDQITSNVECLESEINHVR